MSLPLEGVSYHQGVLSNVAFVNRSAYGVHQNLSSNIYAILLSEVRARAVLCFLHCDQQYWRGVPKVQHAFNAETFLYDLCMLQAQFTNCSTAQAFSEGLLFASVLHHLTCEGCASS